MALHSSLQITHPDSVLCFIFFFFNFISLTQFKYRMNKEFCFFFSSLFCMHFNLYFTLDSICLLQIYTVNKKQIIIVLCLFSLLNWNATTWIDCFCIFFGLQMVFGWKICDPGFLRLNQVNREPMLWNIEIDKYYSLQPSRHC